MGRAGLWRRDRKEMTSVSAAAALQRRSQHLRSLLEQAGVPVRPLVCRHVGQFLGQLSLGRVLDI